MLVKELHNQESFKNKESYKEQNIYPSIMATVRTMYPFVKLAPCATSSQFLDMLHRELTASKASIAKEFDYLKQKNVELANKVDELEAKQRKSEFQIRIMSFEKLYMSL